MLRQEPKLLLAAPAFLSGRQAFCFDFAANRCGFAHKFLPAVKTHYFSGEVRLHRKCLVEPQIPAKLLKIKQFRGDFATNYCTTRSPAQEPLRPACDVEKRLKVCAILAARGTPSSPVNEGPYANPYRLKCGFFQKTKRPTGQFADMARPCILLPRLGPTKKIKEFQDYEGNVTWLPR